jgi:hypothetical protein
MPFFSRNKKPDSSFTEMNEVFSRHAKSVNILPRPGFKEALFARLYAARQAVHMPKVSLANLFLSQKRIFAGAGLTVLVVIVIATMVFQPFLGVKNVFAQDNFVLSAEQSDSLGVEANSAFILESKDPISVSFVEDQLSINTEAKYNLEQVSKNKVRLVFAESLPVSSVVTFALNTEIATSTGETVDRPYHWAFQVKSPFRVLSTLPGNRTSGVAIDAGIEVSFNYENVALKDFEKAFSISPAVKGHIEQFRRTFVFVPEENLKELTIYTATVSGGLGLQDSKDELGQDYIFNFQTSYTERGSVLSLDERYLAATPNSAAVLGYRAWNRGGDEINDPVHVEVHQFISSAPASDFQQYVSALQKARDFDWAGFVTMDAVADVTNMPVVSTFDVTGVENGWQKYIIFPEALPRGYYLADFSVAGQHEFALIESSVITAYVAKAVNETLIWVNSSETKGPINGAEVNFVDFEKASGVSGADGLAVIPVDQSLSADQYSLYDLIEVRSGSEAIVLPLENRDRWFYDRISQQAGSPVLSSALQNWKYFYTDRPMYKPDDTLKFWGYTEDRDSGEKPSQVQVSVSQSWCGGRSCSSYGEQEIIFDETLSNVTERGTFEGSLEFKNVPSGYYQVTVKVDGEYITSRGITVSEYVKPVYTLSITPDTKAAWAGESVGYTVHGEFFEGTPVAGLSVSVEIDNVGTQTLTLDAFGNARGSFVFPYQAAERYFPTSAWLRVKSVRVEEAGIEAGANVLIFGSKVHLEENWDGSFVKDGVGVLKVTARNVQAIDSWDPRIYAPTVRANQIITGELEEITYVKVQQGTTYDFIRKQTIDQYYYDRVEKKIADISLVSDENGEVTYNFPATNPEANYNVTLAARDENGRIEEFSTVVWQKESFENRWPNLRFENSDISRNDPYGFPGYKVGDTVNLQVVQNGAPMTVGNNGQFLYLQAQRGIRETALLDANSYSFPFEASDVPNIAVFGVYFDGSAYAEIDSWGGNSSGFSIHYDNSEKELNVEVTADKEAYRPGEVANLEVAVTDKNGNPVAAEVNLNIVDEAFYALAEEDVNPLAGLYEYVSDGILATKISIRISEDVTSAEGGGGGERGRVLFKDTADFAVVETDGSGKATYSFTLPDNITAWRVTAQALNGEKKMAGDTKIDIDVSLPFFISPVLRESYLVDDQPTILIRSAGTEIALLSSYVDYTISVDGVETKKTTALASETVRFDLPGLTEGTHEITIKGASGNLSDTITRSVEIVASRLAKPVISSVELGDSTSISGDLNGLTYVTFLDGGRGQYYSELLNFSQVFGDRADEILTRALATNLLNENFGENKPEPPFVAYQDRGIRLLSYGDEDFDLSVKVAMLGETPFNETGLIEYFSNILYYEKEIGETTSAEEAAKAYAAMAALGEPVLSEVQRFAAESDLGTNEKLYLALALHFSGDDEGARTIYRELVKNLTKESGYAYLAADDVETQSEQTALLAILAGALRESDRDALHDFVINQDHNNTLLVLDDVLYLKETLKTLKSSTAKVSYTFEGERREVQLENGKTLTLALSANELSALDPKIEAGSVVAVSNYNTPLVSEGGAVDANLGLKRTYSKVDSSATNSFKEGDLIKVQIVYTVPLKKDSADLTLAENYEITDVLPSSLAIVTPTDSSWSNNEICQSWPAKIENQRVSFFVDNYVPIEARCGFYTLTYFARVVTPGTYVAEPAYIRSVRDPESNNHSDEVKITISE